MSAVALATDGLSLFSEQCPLAVQGKVSAPML